LTKYTVLLLVIEYTEVEIVQSINQSINLTKPAEHI